jgi:hypothetical protein
VIGKLQKHLGKLGGKTVALLGLAFKPNTDDLREAPSLVLASRLLAEGAEVRAWDPVATRRAAAGRRVLRQRARGGHGADAAVIVTEWDELRELASGGARRDARPLIVDGRNLLDPETARPPASPTRASAAPLAARALPETEEPSPSSALVEAIILAGGKAERLGDAAGGRPKALVRVAAGRSRRTRSSSSRARASSACSSAARRARRAVRGGARRHRRRDRRRRRAGAARPRRRDPLRRAAAREDGRRLALNGDELVDVDLGALLERTGSRRRRDDHVVAAALAVRRRRARRRRRVTGFREAPRSTTGSAAASTSSARRRSTLPERGDHETSTFPSCAGGRLLALPPRGLWLTVNTPKDLRVRERAPRRAPGWPRLARDRTW